MLYFAVVFLLIGKPVKKYCGVPFSRKLIHILTGFFWFIYDAFFGCSIHQILICFAFCVLAVLSKKFNLIKAIENSTTDSNGTVYYAIAIFCIMTLSFFVPALYPLVGFAVIALSVGDGAATLIGRYTRSKKIYHEKTLFGFLGCILFSFVGFALYNYFYCNLFGIVDLILVAMLVGIFEEEDCKGLDNITVTFSAFGALVMLTYIADLYPAFIAFIGLFAICFFCRVMTYHGSLLSAFIGASFLKIGGVAVALFLFALYMVIIAAHVYRKVRKIQNKDIVKKSKEKDLMQVVANGAVSLVFLYLYLFLQNERLLVIALIVFANSFVDSVASDIGSTSSKQPYDLFKRKYVDPGCSGGVSWLGSVSAFLASIAFAAAIVMIKDQSLLVMLYAIVIMDICCFADTFMGSCLQVKYQCPVCGLVTEKEFHHGEKLPKVAGYRFFNNDTVNLLCSCLCGVLALPVLVL